MPLLKTGVKGTWLACFLIGAFLTIASFVFINMAQAYLLTDGLKWPRERLGRAQGNLSSTDELVALFMVVIWGVISDRIGRRPVFAAGFLLMSLALFLYPLAGSVYGSGASVFNSLLFYRVIFAFGGSAAADMLTVVVADYAGEGRRARLSGIMGFSTGLGACFGVFVLVRAVAWMGIKGSFWLASALMAVGFLIVALGVKPAPKAASEDKETVVVERCWWKKMVIGFKLVRSKPALVAAYLGAFVARGDSIMLPVFLSPWIASLNANQDAKTASKIVGYSQLMALLGAPLIGWLGDRFGRGKLMCFIALLSATSQASMLFLQDPTSKVAILLVCLQGFAQIGMIIGSMAVLAAEAPPESRGAVGGVYSLWGALGIIVISKLGGMLADGWMKSGPFALIAIFNLLLALASLFVL